MLPPASTTMIDLLVLPYVVVPLIVFSFLSIGAVATALGRAYSTAAVRSAELRAAVDLAQQGYSADEVEQLIERTRSKR